MPRLRGRIERYGSVPEDMHQALSSGLGVPDAAAYDAAGPGHPTHLENGPVHVGDELQDEERQRSIEGRVGVRQRPGVADIKAQARRRCVLTRKRDVGLRGINSNDLRPARAGRGRHRESACTTADVEQPVSVSEPGEVEEHLRQSPAPAGHISFVRLGGAEHTYAPPLGSITPLVPLGAERYCCSAAEGRRRAATDPSVRLQRRVIRRPGAL